MGARVPSPTRSRGRSTPTARGRTARGRRHVYGRRHDHELHVLCGRAVAARRRRRGGEFAGRSGDGLMAGVGGRGVGHGFHGRQRTKTPFAVGNVAGAATTFTSEKMKGADAVFGSNNVAPVVPVTDAALLAMYGLNGVSAAPAGADADVAGGPVDGADAEPAPTGGGGSARAGGRRPDARANSAAGRHGWSDGADAKLLE